METNLRFERCVCSYKNLSDRFFLKGRKFDLQYSQLYAVRLMAMKKKLAVAVRKKWGRFLQNSEESNVSIYLHHT